MTVEKDPNGIDQHQPGAKLDANKPLPWLFMAGFANAIQAVVDVTTHGALKYTPGGWAHVANGQERYMEAFGRHMLALGTGENIDPASGALHKAQMIWNLLASLELELRSPGAESAEAEPEPGTETAEDALARWVAMFEASRNQPCDDPKCPIHGGAADDAQSDIEGDGTEDLLAYLRNLPPGAHVIHISEA